MKYHLANSTNSALNEKAENRYRNPRHVMKPMSRRALKNVDAASTRKIPASIWLIVIQF
jgi:hypothetical protein